MADANGFGLSSGLGWAVSQSLLSKGLTVSVVGGSLNDLAVPLRSVVRADLSSLADAVVNQPIEPIPRLVADDHCARVFVAAEALTARVPA